MRALTEGKFKGEPRYVYCGPYAISAITGKSIEEVEDALNRRRGKPAGTRVTRTWSGENMHIIPSLGFKSQTVYENRRANRHGPTLAYWLRNRETWQMNQSYLILVTGHWIAVRGRKMVDTYSKEPVFIGKCKHRRKRVQVIIRIEK